MASALRSIGERSVWVVDEGDGPAVLCIHGLGGTSNFYDALAAALGGTHRVLSFDLSGHGMSPQAKDTSIEGWVDDAIAILDDVGVAVASVVGHSMGTLVVQQLLAEHGERFDRAVLLGPIRDLPAAGRDAQHQRAAAVRESGMAAVAHTISRAATSATVQAEQPAVVAFVKELLQRQSPEGYAAACEALAASSPPDVSAFAGPVLLVTGSDDGISPPDRLDSLAATFPLARSMVIDGIGHWTAIEAAADVNHAIAEFLAPG